jgi:hypothetical protein
VLTAAHAPTPVASAVLIGVDLDPNFRVTGSLSTIFWLTALRHEGIESTARSVLNLDVVVTLPPYGKTARTRVREPLLFAAFAVNPIVGYPRHSGIPLPQDRLH